MHHVLESTLDRGRIAAVLRIRVGKNRGDRVHRSPILSSNDEFYQLSDNKVQLPTSDRMHNGPLIDLAHEGRKLAISSK